MAEPSPIERALLAKKVGAVFLPERVVRRVIKEHRQIGGIGFQVPHSHCYSLPSWALRKIVDKEELGELDPDHEAALVLPAASGEGDDALVSVWRAAFHAAVHRALEARVMAGELPPAAVRARIHALGQTEFDEIRYVLGQDDLLLPPHDDTEAYLEFAATYLEQHHFAPDVLLRTFPGLRDASSAVLRTLARDVDADALLAACRPEGAPSTNELWARVSEPPSSRTARPFVPHAHAQRDAVPPAADIARAQGNTIRSLIYRVRAKGTEEAVNDELVAFCNRLSAALVWVDAPTESWAEILLPVLHHTRTALGMPWNAEARMLFDLQKACVDYEREREALGVVEWALSLGKVPVRRPLPAEREVRIAGHVLAALDKVPKMRLPEEHRQALVGLLASLAAQAEQNVRTSLGPRIEAALDSVGLTAHDVTERASRRKLVDELLDQILKDRFIAFGQVRDSLSRNNIKLPDVTSQELVGGDALLRLDRLLARDLDGVYRPGEVYLRSLQKLSSLSFGSRVGRFVSLYLLLPVVAAYVVLAGLEHTVGLVLVKVFGFRHVAYASTVPLVCATVLAFGLIHSARVRSAALLLWSGIKYLLRAVFIRLPLWLWHLPFVRDLLRTEGMRQFARFVLKPAALAGVDPSIENPRRGAARGLRDDIAASVELLERKLPGRRVRHLAFPIYLGSDEAVGICRELGFEGCYWGLQPDRPLNRRGESPFRVSRLSDEFVRRLPGRGRASWSDLAAERLRRIRAGRAWRRRYGSH